MDKTVAVNGCKTLTKKLKQKDHLSELDGPIGEMVIMVLTYVVHTAIEAIKSTEPQSAAKCLRQSQWP